MTTRTTGIATAPGRGEPGATIMAPAPLAVALGRIAQAVSGALELKDVFTGVAEAAATVLPFDIMAVGGPPAAGTRAGGATSRHTPGLPCTPPPPGGFPPLPLGPPRAI